MSGNLGSVRLTFDLLDLLLHLPEGHHVTGIRDGLNDTVELCISGPTLPEVEIGAKVPEVRALFRQEIVPATETKKITCTFEPI